ncbi:MAG: DUF916 domain-containing protein [Actinomycetota bacterium]|nr:DUF916 domain-containing protein [Actinomycetota bacterium]
MNTWRRLVLLATTSAAAFLASALPASVASAGPPMVGPANTATTPPAPAPPAPDGTAPDGQAPPTEVVESWALAPAGSADPDGTGNRPDLTYVADPGAVLEDAVTLYNYGTVQLTFRVYATDAFNNDAGQFDLLPGDEVPVDVGTWVAFPQELITVPAGTQVTMPITITIPVDARPGDHTGAILASSETLGTGDQGQVVTLDRRIGSRLYVRVSGPISPELAVADVETDYDHALNPMGGSARVTYRIENHGNVRLGGSATLTIGGPFGIGEQTIALPDVPELLPGEGITVTADVRDVPALFLGSATVSVTPLAVEGGATGAASADDLTFVPPVAVLLLLLLVILFVLARRAHRRHRGPVVPAGRHAPIIEASVAGDTERAREPQTA